MKTLNFNSTLILITSIITIIFAYISINSWISSLTTSHELISIDEQYIGRDFIFFYAAAKEVVINNVHHLYDNYYASETTSAIFPELGSMKLSNWVWLYPPHYLLLIAPLGFLPYHYALAAWLAISILLPVITLRYFWRINYGFLFIAIFNINIFICLIMGQNALILSSIAGIGIASMKKQPWLAGICFAIVSMKPHFAILIPVALVFGRYWQTLIYTIISTLILMTISSFLFGWDVYIIAVEHFSAVQNYSLASNHWFFSIYSTYRALLDIGFLPAYAWMGHLVIASISIYYFQKIWWQDYHLANKWLAFGITALLCTPYNLSYDAVWITLPSIFMFSHLTSKQQKYPYIYYLLILQIFAFAIISINQYLAILLIASALAILFELSSKKYVNNI